MVSRAALVCWLCLAGVSLPADSGALTGRWKLVFERGDTTREYYADLLQSGKRLSGAIVSPGGETRPIHSGEVDGDKVEIRIDRESDGRVVTQQILGTLERTDTIVGTFRAGGDELASARMEKLPSPVGEWNVTSYSPDGSQEWESTLSLERTANGLTGVAKGQLGESPVRSIAWKKDALVVRFDLDLDGNVVPIELDVAFKDAHTLDGKWKAVGSDGTEYTGDWGAVRDTKGLLVGRWNVSAESDGQASSSLLDIVLEDEKLSGTYTGDLGERLPLRRVEVNGSSVAIALSVDLEERSVTFLVAGLLEGSGAITGRWSVEGSAEYSGAWSAKRETRRTSEKPADFSGAWDSVAVLPSGDEVEFALEITGKGERPSGALSGERGKQALRDLRVEGRRLRFVFDYETDQGDTVRIDFSGTLRKDGAVDGEWKTESDAEGTWRAKRRPQTF